MQSLTLRRSPHPVLPPQAYPETSAGFPEMLVKDWTGDAFWSIPDEDLAKLGGLSEHLYALAVRVADSVLGDDARLDALEVPEPVRARMRSSRASGQRNVLCRLDLALAAVPGEPDRYVPWLLEVNGDTPGNFVEGGLIQHEWGLSTGHRTSCEGLAEQVSDALRQLPAPLAVLHHPGDAYIAALARWLVARVPGATRVEYPAVPGPEARSVYKIFRWGRLWAGRFPEVAAWAEGQESRVYEPPWCALLQHKGLLAEMWSHAPDFPHLLPATLAGPSALPDGGAAGWAQKSFYGVGGYEVVVVGPGEQSPEASPGRMATGIWQKRVPPVQVADRYPILCAFIVDGRFGGAVIREGAAAISHEDLVPPLAVTARGRENVGMSQ